MLLLAIQVLYFTIPIPFQLDIKFLRVLVCTACLELD